MTDTNDQDGGGETPRADERPSKAEGEPAQGARRRAAPAASESDADERIAKVIARAGIASRRDAEAMIEAGRVTLNGKRLDSPAINVGPSDRITVDGEPLPLKERTRLWIYHKPRGLVTTARDPQGRPTVFDDLPGDLPRVVTIGRLDINTEGLLLLTNDGGLARVIAHPETGWLRRYRVRAHGDVTQADLDKLKRGITIDGMDYGPVEASLDRVQGDNVWLTLGLREGKNREVKRILEHLGLYVNRLIRLSFGPFQLGDLEMGLVEEVRTRVLKDQLGNALAQEAGVDFESPVREPIAPFGSPKKKENEIRTALRREEAETRRARRGDDAPERPARGREAGRSAPRSEGRGFGRDNQRDEDRPRRFSAGADATLRRPRRDDRERAPRNGPPTDAERPQREERPKPGQGPARKAVWRAPDVDVPAGRKAPRRGADPKEARANTAERQRERIGAIAAPAGRKVLVERLVSTPDQEERPARRMRDRSEARAERGPRQDRGDRPERPEGRLSGGKPARSRSPSRSGGPRPSHGPAPREEREGRDARDSRPARGEGPPRGRASFGAAREDGPPRRQPFSGFKGERSGSSRGGAGERPGRGPGGAGFKAGPRTGGKGGPGGPKGGPKGSPRGAPRGGAKR